MNMQALQVVQPIPSEGLRPVATFNGQSKIQPDSAGSEQSRLTECFIDMIQYQGEGLSSEFLFFTPDDDSLKGSHAWDVKSGGNSLNFAQSTQKLIDIAEQGGLFKLLPRNMIFAENGPGYVEVWRRKSKYLIDKIRSNLGDTAILRGIMIDKNREYAIEVGEHALREAGFPKVVCFQGNYETCDQDIDVGKGTPFVVGFGGGSANAPERENKSALEHLISVFENKLKQHGPESHFLEEVELPDTNPTLLKRSYSVDISDLKNFGVDLKQAEKLTKLPQINNDDIKSSDLMTIGIDEANANKLMSLMAAPINELNCQDALDMGLNKDQVNSLVEKILATKTLEISDLEDVGLAGKDIDVTELQDVLELHIDDFNKSPKERLTAVVEKLAFRNFMLGAFHRANHSGIILNKNYNVEDNWDVVRTVETESNKIKDSDGTSMTLENPVVKISVTPRRNHTLRTTKGEFKISTQDAPRVQTLSHKYGEALWKHVAGKAGATNMQLFRNGGTRGLFYGRFSA